jgi:hypothetical protein
MTGGHLSGPLGLARAIDGTRRAGSEWVSRKYLVVEDHRLGVTVKGRILGSFPDWAQLVLGRRARSRSSHQWALRCGRGSDALWPRPASCLAWKSGLAVTPSSLIVDSDSQTNKCNRGSARTAHELPVTCLPRVAKLRQVIASLLPRLRIERAYLPFDVDTHRRCRFNPCRDPLEVIYLIRNSP